MRQKERNSGLRGIVWLVAGITGFLLLAAALLEAYYGYIK